MKWMEGFTRFPEFQRTTNFASQKLWRTLDKLRKTNALIEGVDWVKQKDENGTVSICVVVDRFMEEAAKIRPDLRVVLSGDNTVKSLEPQTPSEESSPPDNTVKSGDNTTSPGMERVVSSRYSTAFCGAGLRLGMGIRAVSPPGPWK